MTLNSAIALFRTQASASGYVVEEVRLRLPIPDVEVLPRVIIAQQSAPSNIPMTLPLTKHHRTIRSYQPILHTESTMIPIQEPSYRNLSKLNSSSPEEVPPPNHTFLRKDCFEKTGGIKRTVSGSMILDPVPIQTAPSLSCREKGHIKIHGSQPVQKIDLIASTPYLPVKKSEFHFDSGAKRETSAVKEPKTEQFWETVIGGKESLTGDGDTEIPCPNNPASKYDRLTSHESETDVRKFPNVVSFEKEEQREKKEARSMHMENASHQEENRERVENTLHINGHNIPESHVKLLLNSAVTIPQRKRTRTSEKSDVTVENDKKTMNIKINGNSETTEEQSCQHRAALVPPQKPRSTKSRRDLTEKQTSRPSTARPFKCYKCPSSFDRDGHLRVHILAVHEKKRPFVCQVCDASFGHSSSLLRHVRTVHQATSAVGIGKSINCGNLPSGSYYRTSRSSQARENMQDENEKSIRCSTCGQTFQRAALLNRHVARIHPLHSLTKDKISDEQKKRNLAGE